MVLLFYAKTKLLKKIVYILFISLGIFQALAQTKTYTIRGTVFTNQKEPLSDAIVYVDNIDKYEFSDENGDFQFTQVPFGTYIINIHRIGFIEKSDTIEVVKNMELQYFLVSEDLQLDEVTIQGHREEIMNAQSVVTLSGVALDQTKGKTLGEALSGISGLNMLQTGSTIVKPVIHGMHSNRILLMNNGIRQEGQQWGVEHAPEIDPFIASQLTVIKGAAGVQYGSDAIAGVILVEPPDLPKEPGIDGEVNLIGMSNGRQGVLSLMVQEASKKLSGLAWRIQGTVKKAGNLKAPDYFLDNTGVEELNFSGTLDYESKNWGTELYFSRFDTQLGILSASHVGNLTDLENALKNGDPVDADQAEFSYEIIRPFQEVNHNLLASKSFLKLDKIGQIHFTYGWQLNNREEFDRVRESISQSGEPQLDFQLKTHSLDLHVDHKPWGYLKGAIGVNGMKQSNVFKGRQLIPNFRSYTGGVFWLEHYIKAQYELEAGIRYDYRFVETFKNERGVVVRDEFEYNNFSAVLGGTYRVRDHWEIKLSLASAWRPPNVNELFSDGLHQGVASFERGDPTLDPETAYNANVTIDYSNTRFSGSLNVYNNYIQNFIFLEPKAPETVLTIRGAFPLFEYQQVDANFKGLDAQIQFKITPALEWQSKASLVRARNLDEDENLIFIPADRFENSITFNFPTSETLVSPYITLTDIVSMEQTRFPENTDFTDPPDGYNLVGLSGGSALDLKGQKFNVGFEVKNLLNTKYRDYLNRFRYFADEPGINFILRIKYSF